MKQTKKIVIILVIWLSCCSIILYFLYMNRVENAFGNIKEETKRSNVLEKKLGKIQEVKFNNFMRWISKEKGKECIKLIIKTKNKKYNICTIIEKQEESYHTTGYIIGDKITKENKFSTAKE